MAYLKQSEFLAKIKPGCYGSWIKHKILPSITAAQAILESGWGSSGLTTKANNLFGIKGKYKGQSVVMSTGEQSAGGGWYTINAEFRKYPSWGASISDHAEVLKLPYYKGIVGEQDLDRALACLKPYATAHNYAGMLKGLINTHNLRAWDLDVFKGNTGGFTGSFDDGGGLDSGKNYKEELIKKHGITRPGNPMKKIEGVVVYDIQNSGGVKSARATLNAGNANQGYHLLVDEKSALLVVPPSEQVYQGGKLTNYLSVGIVQANPKKEFSTKLNIQAALAIAEIIRTYKLNGKNVFPAWQATGLHQPASWWENPFMYTAFAGMVSNAVTHGDNVITNPDYNDGSGPGQGGLIPGGKGVIQDMIKYALSLKGSMTYILQYQSDIRPGGYGDCSSFVQACVKKFTGFDITRTTQSQWDAPWGKKISKNDVRAGDILYFEKTYPTPLPTSHVGIALNSTQMIDFGSTPGPQINNFRDAFWSGHWYGAKRLFSDAEYDQSQNNGHVDGAGSIPNRPSLDPRGAFALRIDAPTNLLDAPGGISVRRAVPGEVFQVQEVGSSALRLRNNLYVRRGNDDVSIAKLESHNMPIGSVKPKIDCRVYTKPSYTASPIIERGQEKIIDGNRSPLSVYAVENGFAQISISPEEWMVAGSLYADISLEASFGGNEEVSVDLGTPVETKVSGLYVADGYLTLEGHRAVNRIGVYCHKDLMPIGAVVELNIPSNEEYNTTAVVVSHDHKGDPNHISLIFNSRIQQSNFGSRDTKMTWLKTLNTSSEIDTFIQDQLRGDE